MYKKKKPTLKNMNNRIVSVIIKMKSIYLDLVVSDTNFKNRVHYFETKVQLKYANFNLFLKKWLQSGHQWPFILFKMDF